jgi:hypothetical protein
LNPSSLEKDAVSRIPGEKIIDGNHREDFQKSREDVKNIARIMTLIQKRASAFI